MRYSGICRVINSGSNGLRSCWFHSIPEGTTEEGIKSKMSEIFSVIYSDWEFEWLSEMPHSHTATAIFNWAKC